MREFLKVTCVLVFCAAAIVAAITWMVIEQPDTLTRFLRIVCPVIAISAIVLFARMDRKRDLVPDYLSQSCTWFFEQNGLCFDVEPQFKDDGSFWLFIHYQNRHENPCMVYIGLEPRSKSMGVDSILAHFTCDSAAFGIATVPVMFSASAQGQTVKFKVGATVKYPHGKGKMLRFRDGEMLRMDAKFKNTGRRLLQISLLFAGAIYWRTPASLSFELPEHLNLNLSIDQRTHTKTLWKLGDPPL